MIPESQISRPALGQLVEYIRTEIPRSLGERRSLEDKWIKYQRMYRAVPELELKEFPFLGAANLVVPLIATDVDTIYSRLMGILFGPENLWSCQPLRPDMVEFAPRLQEFMQWAQRQELDAYNAVADFILEMTKLGTGILKQRYKRQNRRVYQFRETMEGPVEEQLDLMVANHPQLAHVSLYDFLIPAQAIDIQTAPWVGERISLSWAQLQQRFRAGIYADTGRLQAWQGHHKGSNIEQERQRLDHYSPGLGRNFELWEAWLDFDITGSGEPMAVLVTMHVESATLLRVDFNPFFNQEKPYSSARFMRQEKRFLGIGLAEMLEMSQEEITTMHNQRLDNSTLANSTMFKARRNVGIREDEPVFPGRWFLLDDMDDVQTLNMGQRYDSTVPYEELTQRYASQRTGVNDYMMGNSSAAIGYGTASTNVLQHTEAAKRFDQTLREVRIALGESGTRLVELYQQFNQGDKVYQAMGEKDGEIVNQIFNFPLELIRHGVAVDVTATSASLNKEVQVRTNTMLMQIVQQYYMQMLQGMQVVLNPQLPQEMRVMVMQAMNGGNIIMRRLLDSYEVQDIDELIPRIQEILNGGQQAIDNGQAALGAGAIPPEGAGEAPGLSALPPGAAGPPQF